MICSTTIFPSFESEPPTFREAVADAEIRFAYTPGPCEMRLLVIDGRTVAISDELLDSIEETASIIGDSGAMSAFNAGVREIANGQTIPWEQVKAKLGL
jgi:hypothetical protein